MPNTMTEAVTQSGIVWKRAAESLLRAVGGCEIQLVVSGSAASDENSRELGLAASESQQFAIAPAVVRWLAAEPGERSRAEVLISAGSLEDVVEATGASSGSELLERALALIAGDQRLRVAAVQVGVAGGTEYLYTVTAVS
jgi:hypothetical protein